MARRNVSARSFHGRGPKPWRLAHWRRDEQPSSSFECHGERLRLDLNDAIPPAHLQRRAGLQGSFAPDFARNHQPTGGIHGGRHGTNNTINLPIGALLLAPSLVAPSPSVVTPTCLPNFGFS
jgi:hypothetical protein